MVARLRVPIYNYQSHHCKSLVIIIICAWHVWRLHASHIPLYCIIFLTHCNITQTPNNISVTVSKERFLLYIICEFQKIWKHIYLNNEFSLIQFLSHCTHYTFPCWIWSYCNLNLNDIFRILLGDCVTEVHQVFTEWISQVIRLYDKSDLVEFEWLIGPVPVE